MDLLDVKLIEKKNVYKGYFEVILYRLQHRLFSRNWSKEITREVFERGHAASALLYDPETDDLVLIEQFRPGAYAALSSPWHKTSEMTPWLIEIVAGIIEEGETPEDVIRRECIEEAGCEVTDIIPICKYLVSPGGSTETMFSFCGRVNSKDAEGIHGVISEGEDIRVMVRNSNEVIAMLGRGEIKNSMTIIPLQWFQHNKKMICEKWLR